MARRTRVVNIGGVEVGGGRPVSVQSMTDTPTADVRRTLRQIRRLAAAGCEIVRVATPDREAAEALGKIVKRSPLPVIADIHFDHRLALLALEAGCHGLRLNPGNIGGPRKVREVAREAAGRGAPIRVGVNAGSLEKRFLKKYGATAEAMVESALSQVGLLEDAGLDAIKVSLKASDVPRTVAAYRLFSKRSRRPLHVGITETGFGLAGTVKSAAGIGSLLLDGIGDTIRVSLTGDPVEEARVGWSILAACGLRRRGVELVSCPTCGRAEIDLARLARQVEKRLRNIETPLRVAVMGCAVNGPGEAREADVGVAGGRGLGILFRKGKLVRKVPEEELLEALVGEVEALLDS